MNNWPAIIQDCLYPPTCLLCGDPGGRQLDLCSSCTASLPYNTHACRRCGTPLHSSAPVDHLCGQCQKQPPEFDNTQTLLIYENPASYLIRALKFNAHYPCARLLGTLMAGKLSGVSNKPEQIIPVPLHAQRYHRRGFNQAIEIARPIARILNIPLNLACCSLTRNTPPQARLSAKERKNNLKNAFTVVKAPLANHVAILDDVVTTGTTVDELAKALRRTGVKRIDVWACARA